MAQKQTRTKEEILTAAPRFVVGGKKGTFVNGKGKMAIGTFDYAQATQTIAYYEQMQMGETFVFELVPVEINPDGSITRQT